MARPQKRRCICSLPRITRYAPQDGKPSGGIQLTYDEYEAIRLLDYARMNQAECARRMGISRTTVTRIYNEARRKIADMLVNGKTLTIGGGDVFVCPGIRPECRDEEQCCHKDSGLVCGWKED